MFNPFEIGSNLSDSATVTMPDYHLQIVSIDFVVVSSLTFVRIIVSKNQTYTNARAPIRKP